MLFNSVQYAFFLPIVFLLYWLLPHRFRWVLLLAASYYFYMSWSVKYVTLILFTTAVSYFAALLLRRVSGPGAKSAVLAVALALCLGLLFLFKYLGFFLDSLDAVFSCFGIRLHPTALKLMLPVGISFYTFQTLSYVIDVYRGDIEPERHFGLYATFISFFPQLVAGPIERTESLLPQLRSERRFDYQQAVYGLRLMVWGFFKKTVLADNLALYVDRIYSDLPGYRGFAMVLGAVFFAIQIYCDFSGYSDIARGSAKLMGIELIENFKSPYFAGSIRDHWARWHISLTRWFRDYVYIPLGGSRVKKPRHYLNLLLTFLASGLWHGASWTYVAWGGLHGLGQIFENAFIPREKPGGSPVVRALRVLAVFVFVVIADVLFRAETLSDAWYVLCHMLDGLGQPVEYLRQGLYLLGTEASAGKKRLAAFILLLAAFDYGSTRTDVIAWIGRQKGWIRHPVSFAMGAIVILCHYYGQAAFIYFQF